MIRLSMLTLAAAMLLAMGNGPLPAGQEAAASQVQDAPTSSFDYPAEHDRSFFGWETVQLFVKAGAMSSQHRQTPPGRVFRFFALGFPCAALMALALLKRAPAGRKARPVFVRLLALPLGSHAPPAFFG
jgi:hypothetical protein